MKLFYRYNVSGIENIPDRKPLIICSNHIKWMDPVSVGLALPINYRIHFMAKKDLFKNALLSYILMKAGAFPVSREGADFAAVKKAYQLLEDGKIIGMFPEGTRSNQKEVRKAYNGAAMIAVRSRAPVLPIAISGPYRLFRPILVNIGKPFVLPALAHVSRTEKKKKLNDISIQIMNSIHELLPSEDDGE